jgi:hypothetical protein
MWVARTKSGLLQLFSSKPYREVLWSNMFCVERWNCNGDLFTFSDNIDLFSDLKWEDEPIEVELVIKNNV